METRGPRALAVAAVIGLAAILAVGLAFAAVGANGGGIGFLGDDADANTDTPANPGGAASDGDSGGGDGNAAVGESDADRDEDAADDSAGTEIDSDAGDASGDTDNSDDSGASGDSGDSGASGDSDDSGASGAADETDANDGTETDSDDSDASGAADETDANDGTETDSDGGDAGSDVNDGGDDGTDEGDDDAGVSISAGESVTAAADQRTSYTVTASAGETVDVVASGQGGEATLLGPDGTELASTTVYADRTSFGAEAPADGEYTIVVDAGMDSVRLTVETVTGPSNTDRSSASAVGGGDSVTADLTAGSTHWYELEDGADEVTVENLRPYIGNDVEVALLDADGNELDAVTVGPEAVSPASASLSDEDAAYVAVRGANVRGATAYELTVSEESEQESENGADGSDDESDAASTRLLDERVDPDSTERFTFEADAGEELTVIALGQGGALTLLGPDGEELKSIETTGDGVAVGATAPTDGEYTLVVESGFDGVRAAVDAAEPASNTDRSSATQLSDGDVVNASIPEGEEHWYAVEVGAGEDLEAELAHVRSTSNTQVRVETATPDGEPLDAATADLASSGRPANVSATADEAGTYYVVVTGLSGTSEYELEVTTR